MTLRYTILGATPFPIVDSRWKSGQNSKAAITWARWQSAFVIPVSLFLFENSNRLVILGLVDFRFENRNRDADLAPRTTPSGVLWGIRKESPADSRHPMQIQHIQKRSYSLTVRTLVTYIFNVTNKCRKF